MDDKDLNECWQHFLSKRTPKVFSPIVRTFTLSEKQQEQYKLWESKLPKKLKKINYAEWHMFSGKGGIGLSVKIRREYDNGDVREIDVTDVSEW